MNTINYIENILFNLIQDDLLFFTIILSAIIGKLKESSKNNIFTVWIMYLIGTFFHELAHLILTILTFGKPSWFSIFPSISMFASNNISVSDFILDYNSLQNKNICVSGNIMSMGDIDSIMLSDRQNSMTSIFIDVTKLPRETKK